MLPHSIKRIRKTSGIQRERIIGSYLNAPPFPGTDKRDNIPSACLPEYLLERGLIESHILRTELELAGVLPDAKARAYTRSRVTGYSLSARRGSLCEVSIAALSTPLKVRANLHVAASFFSTMVSVADDYLDAEGSYETYGGKLFYVSHAYRDLIDLALQDEVDSGALTLSELKEIRTRLSVVLTCLINSEETTDADKYLYRKSCGDKVISVLFPASEADNKTRKLCAEIGRATGEAGQLIDDILDYRYDLLNSKKNFIIMKEIDISDAIEAAETRIDSAAKAAEGLKQYEPVSWVLGSMKEVAGLIRGRRNRGLPNNPATLKLSSSLGTLLEKNVPAEQLLFWL